MKLALVVLGLISVVWSAQCSKPATAPRHPLLGSYVVAGYPYSTTAAFCCKASSGMVG